MNVALIRVAKRVIDKEGAHPRKREEMWFSSVPLWRAVMVISIGGCSGPPQKAASCEHNVLSLPKSQVVLSRAGSGARSDL